MKHLNSKKIKNIAISTVSSMILVAPTCLNSVAHASGTVDNNVEVHNLKSLGGNDLSMTIDFKEANETVDMSINQINENLIEVNTSTSNGDIHHLTYDKVQNIMIMDGEKVDFNIESFVEKELEDESKSAKSAWDPVYVTSYKINVGKQINSLGAICTVIGGVIATAALLGVSIASSAIASLVSNWAGSIGLGSLAAGHYLSGNLNYKKYRTKAPVQPPMGAKQTAYRFQDVRFIGKVKGKNMNLLLKSVGSWWFGNKPHAEI